MMVGCGRNRRRQVGTCDGLILTFQRWPADITLVLKSALDLVLGCSLQPVTSHIPGLGNSMVAPQGRMVGAECCIDGIPAPHCHTVAASLDWSWGQWKPLPVLG